MQTIDLSPSIKDRLLAVSQKLGRTEAELIKEAVLSFLEEIEDIQEAQQRLNNPPTQYLTLEKVEQELGLAD
ncbi:CopG family transcriptional regulator [Synechocystis salina LEGE 06099]|uniref:type II toxin-antitoxin system RelB family antitoxin n=1 Tax=Synechocystis salina TaxID=945780 RepID=UPI00187FFF1C|nr:CopG family transcriptional regulator [Synechocystis salina]MBE9202321.1 CopG family transcriptional regulator [Synechocystis salina LEGE 06099]